MRNQVQGRLLSVDGLAPPEGQGYMLPNGFGGSSHQLMFYNHPPVQRNALPEMVYSHLPPPVSNDSNSYISSNSSENTRVLYSHSSHPPPLHSPPTQNTLSNHNLVPVLPPGSIAPQQTISYTQHSSYLDVLDQPHLSPQFATSNTNLPSWQYYPPSSIPPYAYPVFNQYYYPQPAPHHYQLWPSSDHPIPHEAEPLVERKPFAVDNENERRHDEVEYHNDRDEYSESGESFWEEKRCNKNDDDAFCFCRSLLRVRCIDSILPLRRLEIHSICKGALLLHVFLNAMPPYLDDPLFFLFSFML